MEKSLLHTLQMALPKFYLEPRKPKHDKVANLKLAINMFFSIYGERLQYYTGIRIDPKFYRTVDNKGNSINRNDVGKLISESAPYATTIKTNLKQIALDVQNIANTAKVNKIPVTKELLTIELDKIHKHKPEEIRIKSFNFISYFEDLIEKSKNGKRVLSKGKNAGKRYSSNTIKNYGSTLSSLKRFMAAKRIKNVDFNDINKLFYEQFKAFCYSSSENKEISTFGGFIKDIITVMDDALEEGYHESRGHQHSTFILPSYESDTKALTLDEIDIIHELDLSDKPRMDRVRDLFLIGCYSALRFRNFNNLKVEDIEDSYIRLRQIKTGERITIPIIKRLKKVLDKYNGDLPSPVSNQEFNRIIKNVVKEAGLDYLVDVKSFNGGVMHITHLPIYELVSSHTARRSYATVMFKLAIPTLLIMSATGHKTETSFLKYIRATNEEKAILMAEAMKQRGL